jgi:hypothetical protein
MKALSGSEYGGPPLCLMVTAARRWLLQRALQCRWRRRSSVSTLHVRG